MPRGGARPGSGRPKGAKTKQDVLLPTIGGLTPLELLLRVVESPELPLPLRMEAAKISAPYVHRKLAPEPVVADEKDALPPEEVAWERDLGVSAPN